MSILLVRRRTLLCYLSGCRLQPVLAVTLLQSRAVNRFTLGRATAFSIPFIDRLNNFQHKVIIVGLDNAGKTTILYQFLMNEVVQTSPTIGSNVEEIIWKNIRFIMWDIGGQESLRNTWNSYFTNTKFVILVIDSTDRERLSVSKEELHKMLACEDLRKSALLVYANKQDVRGAMTAAEISQQLGLTRIKDHTWHIQACCALTGEGLYQGLQWLVSCIRR